VKMTGKYPSRNRRRPPSLDDWQVWPGAEPDSQHVVPGTDYLLGDVGTQVPHRYRDDDSGRPATRLEALTDSRTQNSLIWGLAWLLNGCVDAMHPYDPLDRAGPVLPVRAVNLVHVMRPGGIR